MFLVKNFNHLGYPLLFLLFKQRY